MQIEWVDIHKLRDNPKNRNHHSAEQIDRLAEIIKYQGWRFPIIADKSNTIWAGHGRLLAAKKLGEKQVPVSYQEFTSEEQAYAFLVSDNAIASWAELDLSGINTDLADLGPDFNIDLLGIKDFVLEPAEKLEPGCDEDEIPEKVEPKTKLGDIYQLGRHRLMCGDSTSIDAVEKLMNGEKADMVFTDPPYNQPESGSKNYAIGRALHKQMASIAHLINFEPQDFLNVLPTVFDSNLNAYIFTSKDLLPDYLQWAKSSGYSFNVLVWKKPNAIPIGGSHRPDVEYLLVLRKSGIFNSGIPEISYSKVIECKRDSSGLHPTMKPIEIIENQLKIGSNAGSIVSDVFGGSGSTLIACEKTNRKCFMMELDPHYCDIIVARWEKYTGKKAELLNG